MASESPTKLIRDVQAEVGILNERLNGLRNEFGQTGVGDLRDKLFRLGERIAVLEERVNELKRLKDEADRRFWQFGLLFVGGLITLAINFTLTFLRK